MYRTVCFVILAILAAGTSIYIFYYSLVEMRIAQEKMKSLVNAIGSNVLLNLSVVLILTLANAIEPINNFSVIEKIFATALGAEPLIYTGVGVGGALRSHIEDSNMSIKRLFKMVCPVMVMYAISNVMFLIMEKVFYGLSNSYASMLAEKNIVECIKIYIWLFMITVIVVGFCIVSLPAHKLEDIEKPEKEHSNKEN